MGCVCPEPKPLIASTHVAANPRRARTYRPLHPYPTILPPTHPSNASTIINTVGSLRSRSPTWNERTSSPSERATHRRDGAFTPRRGRLTDPS
eukprot:5500027-Pyramimonas_sp.AAC.1